MTRPTAASIFSRGSHPRRDQSTPHGYGYLLASSAIRAVMSAGRCRRRGPMLGGLGSPPGRWPARPRGLPTLPGADDGDIVVQRPVDRTPLGDLKEPAAMRLL